MKHLHAVIAAALFTRAVSVQGQQTESTAPRTINLHGTVVSGHVTQGWHKPKKIWGESVTKSKCEYTPPITRRSARHKCSSWPT